MSQRGKRPNNNNNHQKAAGSAAIEEGPPPIKRRKGRPPGSGSKNHLSSAAANAANADDEAIQSSSGTTTGSNLLSKSWQPKPHSDMKSIYNRSAPEAPAELFRKDLISAMKLPDSEPLSSDEYWLIVDQWKQEWERGVQVPVNPDSLPEACVNSIADTSIQRGRQDFKL